MPDVVHSLEVTAPVEALDPLISRARGLSTWWVEDGIALPDGLVELGSFLAY